MDDLYFIQEAGSNYIKIGRGKSNQRQGQLQTGNPRLLILRLVIPMGGWAEKIYKIAFERFRVQHGGTEWFLASSEILAEIERLEKEMTNENQDDNRDVEGITPDNVRPICGRQQNTTSAGTTDVSGQTESVVYPINQCEEFPMRGEYKLMRQDVRGKGMEKSGEFDTQFRRYKPVRNKTIAE